MRKLLIATAILFFATHLHAQTFNDLQKLKPGKISLGIEPAFILNGNNHMFLMLHGALGVTKGVDLGLSYGTLGASEYFKANVKMARNNNFSLALGVHKYGVYGFDATLLARLPISQSVRLFTGIDSAINIYDDSAHLLLWFPVGMEVGIRKGISLIFDAEIGLTQHAYNIIGLGFNFYL